MAAYGNGQIPLTALVRVQPGLYLTPLAAASWLRIVAGVQAQFGWTPFLTDAYRIYSEQVRIFVDRYDVQASGGGYWGDVRKWNGVRYVRRRYRKSDGKVAAAAAVPGTSNHGNATAVDVANLGAFGSQRFNEFASVATRNGWSIAEGRSVNEPWHWTKNSTSYVNNPGQSVGTIPVVPGIDPIDPINPEDDMFENGDRAALQAAAENASEARKWGPRSTFVMVICDSQTGVPEYGSTGVYSDATGFIRTSKGLGPRDELGAWAAIAGALGFYVEERHVDQNGWIMAHRFARSVLQIAPADVDEAALATALAPLLPRAVLSLDAAGLAAVAKAVQDEQDRRDRERLS